MSAGVGPGGREDSRRPGGGARLSAPRLDDPAAVRTYVAAARAARVNGRAEGRRRAEDGMARAARRAEFDRWNHDHVRPVVVALAATGEEFCVDDVRAFPLPPDPSPGAMGAAFSIARREGIVERASRTPPRRSATPSTHRRFVQMWTCGPAGRAGGAQGAGPS